MENNKRLKRVVPIQKALRVLTRRKTKLFITNRERMKPSNKGN